MLKREMLKRAVISKKLIYSDRVVVGCDYGEGEIIVNASINFHRVIVHIYIFRFHSLRQYAWLYALIIMPLNSMCAFLFLFFFVKYEFVGSFP